MPTSIEMFYQFHRILRVAIVTYRSNPANRFYRIRRTLNKPYFHFYVPFSYLREFISLNCTIRKLDINTRWIFRTHFPRPMMCGCHFKRECVLFFTLCALLFICIQRPTYFTLILMNCFHFDFLHLFINKIAPAGSCQAFWPMLC